MKKLTLPLIIKSSLLFIVYIGLAIKFVFLTPQTVPHFDELEMFEISSDSIYCVESLKKNPDYTKIKGVLNGKEIKTYDIGTKRCLEVFGITQQFIRYKTPPKTYKIYVEKDEIRLFGEGYRLFQIETNNDVLLGYEETSKHYLKTRKKFFYFSVGIFIFISIPLIRLFYKKLSA